MQPYLKKFHMQLKKQYAGSLVSVDTAKKIHKYAKQYLIKLAKEELVEKINWGWYYIPNKAEDIWDFLRSDINLKIVAGQSAASFYNQDFIHRDIVVLKVPDKSFANALKEYVKKKGWKVELKYFKGKIKTRKIQGLLVEELEETVSDCLQGWAFIDAFSAIYSNRKRVDLKRLEKNVQWKRISGTDVRMRQALNYGLNQINDLADKHIFPEREVRLSDNYVQNEIDEAIEKVVEFA